MTNAMIIFAESQRLAEEGQIAYTGRTFEMVDAEGNTITVKETEPIHTYLIWKELGYQVQKGQKAITKLTIWKHTAKVNEETGEQEDAKMFMKTAAFFSRAQVDEITTAEQP